MNDTLGGLLVQSLSCHQAGCNQSGILPQPGQELPIDRFLETQGLVAIDELCIFQHFGMLATLCRGGLRTTNRGLIISVHHRKSSVPAAAFVCQVLEEVQTFDLNSLIGTTVSI